MSVSFDYKELVNGLGPETSKELRASETVSPYPPGSVLFAEGQVPSGVFLVYEGRIRLSNPGSKSKRPGSRMAQAGEILGLSAAISGEPYEVTAETVSSCQIGFIRRADFISFMHQHCEFTFRLVQLLSEHLDLAFEHVRSLHDTHARRSRH